MCAVIALLAATSRGAKSQDQLRFTSDGTMSMRCVYRRKGERNRHRGIDLHVRMSRRVARALLAATGMQLFVAFCSHTFCQE